MTLTRMSLIVLPVYLQFGILIHLSQTALTNKFSAASITTYKKLLQDLFDGYDTRVRPRLNQSSTVEVNSSFTLTSIIEFDTTGQSIDVMCHIAFTWFDEVLRWDPNEYEQTNYIRVKVKDIWFPQIEFTKTRDAKILQDNKETEGVMVLYNGLVEWIPNGIFNSLCEVNVEYYPFDVQTCDFIYHATGDTLETVFLNGPDSVQIYEILPNSEWRIVKTSVTVDDTHDTNIVFIKLTVKRRAEFTVYTMIVPLATLALVNVFTFLVPIDSGEKGSLSITLFLAYGFFATITRDSLPHNSVHVSFYIVYVTALLIFSVFTVIYVIIEAKIYSSIGSDKCNIFRSNSNLGASRSESNSGEKNELENEPLANRGLVWNDVLKMVDMIFFFLSLLAMVMFSSLLWYFVIQNADVYS